MSAKSRRGKDGLREARESVLRVRGEVADFSHDLALENRRALEALEEQISALGPYCPRELLACKDDMFAASRSTDISLQNTLAGLAVLCDKL